MCKKNIFFLLSMLYAFGVSAQSGISPIKNYILYAPLQKQIPLNQKKTSSSTDGSKWFSDVMVYDFESDNSLTTGVIGAADSTDGIALSAHTQTSYGSNWHRISDTAQMSSSSFAANYPEFVSNNYAHFIREGLSYYNYWDPTDNGFMFISSLDDSDASNVLNAWFEIGPVDMSNAGVTKIRFNQVYAKWFDTCYIDYTDANGEWHSVIINADVSVNYLKYGTDVRLPLDACHSNLKVRFRIYSNKASVSNYCYFWAIDHIVFESGTANSLRVEEGTYVEGAYGLIPKGMHLPLSWNCSVTNDGAITQTGVWAGLFHCTHGWNDTTAYIYSTIASTPSYTILAGESTTLSLIGSTAHTWTSWPGWFGFSPDYSSTMATTYNNGLPSDSAGNYSYESRVYYSNYYQQPNFNYYTVTDSSDGMYLWAHDNGQLLSNLRQPEGIIGYAGHGSSVRMTTGNDIPTDADGNPWVVRGVEIVPAVTPDNTNYAGTELTAIFQKDVYNDDGNYVNFFSIATGAGNHIVDANELNTQYGIFELGEYNTIRILFPEEPVLEPNTSYRIGFSQVNDHAFNVAVTGDSVEWGTEYGWTIGNNRGGNNNYYITYNTDGSVGYWGSSYSVPLVRMLVGPRTPNTSTHTVTVDIDDNIYGQWYGNGENINDTNNVFTVRDGSTHSIYYETGYFTEIDTVIVSSISGIPRYHIVNENGGYRLWLDSITNDILVRISVNPACHKNEPYGITRGGDWENDCWQSNSGSLGNDNTVVSFDIDQISSPWITLSDNTNYHIVSFTVRRPMTSAKWLLFSITDTANNTVAWKGVQMISDSLTWTVPFAGQAGKKVRFTIWVDGNQQDYDTFQLTDFALYPFNGTATVYISDSTVSVGDTLTLSVTTDDGQGHPADNYWWWCWDGDHQHQSSDSTAYFVYSTPGNYSITYDCTWNNVWNGHSATIDGQIPVTVTLFNCPEPGIATSSITENSAWLDIVPPDSNSVTSFQIDLSTDSSTWNSYTITTQRGLFLSELDATTQYYVRVRSVCGENHFSQYATTSFTTSIAMNTTECEPVVVGDNSHTTTNGNYLPLYSFYDYSYSQQLFTASELGGQSRNIDTISLQYYSNSPKSRNIKIYLCHTEDTNLSSGYLPGSILDLVYSGTVDFNNQGADFWVTIPLNSVFEYNGTDNLVVAIVDNTGSYTGGSYFCTHSTPQVMARYNYRDSNPYDIHNPPTGTGISYRNNIRFGIQCPHDVSPTCGRPNIRISNIGVNTVNIDLMTSAEYQLQLREAGTSEYVDAILDTSSIIHNLKQNTRYQLRARNICSNSDTSGWLTVSFKTLPSESQIVYVTQHAAGIGDGSSWSNATDNLNYALDCATAHIAAFGTPATVWVAAGIYYGDTTSDNAFTIHPGVSVYGGFAGNESENYDLSLRNLTLNHSTLDGNNQRRVLYQAISFDTTDAVVWDGFTLQNGEISGNGAGAYLQGNATLRHCVVKNNYSHDSGGGIHASGTTSMPVTIEQCEITNNRAYRGGGANLSSTILNNCLVANNTASDRGGGLYISTFSGINITGSTIVANTASNYGGICTGNINLASDYPQSLNNSIVWGNTSRNTYGSDNQVYSNIIISYSAVQDGVRDTTSIVLSQNNTGAYNSPRFVAPTEGAGADYTGGDWHLSDSSICINHGFNALTIGDIDMAGSSRIQHGTVDMGCYESPYSTTITAPIYPDNIVYVSVSGAGLKDGTSWQNAIPNLQDAITIASSHGYTVWIAEGTYYGDTLQRNAFVATDGVNVYGGFAGNEPATYDLSLRDFEAHTTILDGQNRQRVLQQPSVFNTITTWDGLTIQNGRVTYSNGHGAGVFSYGNLNISNCVIRDNHVLDGDGGGLFKSSISESELYISNTQILNNTTSTSSNGAFAGGGLSVYHATITNCRISGNSSKYGGGMDVSYSTVTNCHIDSNNALSGAAIRAENHCRINNCIIDHNTYASTSSSTYAISGGWAVFEGCNIVNNYCGAASYARLYNCIVWGNQEVPGLYNATLNTTAIEGGYDYGTYVINLASANDGNDATMTYVRFLDPENGDYHLHSSSQLIDAGDSTLVTQTSDFDGNVRLFGNNVDIGAYESSEISSCPSPIGLQVSSVTGSSAQLSWSPAQGVYYIVQYGIRGSNVFDTIGTADTVITLTDLAVNRQYTARVRVLCEGDGASAFSFPVSFTTICDSTLLTLSDFTTMQPADSTIVHSSSVAFSWTPVPEAGYYDFYMWKEGSSEPQEPTRTHITDTLLTQTIPNFSSNRGTLFHWKVVAWNECISRSSNVINIKIADRPNLLVCRIVAPDTVDNTKPVTLHWWLKNTGQGNIENSYITDAISSGSEIIQTFSGQVSIAAGDSLERTTTIQLPCSHDSVGQLEITTDNPNHISEADETDNTSYSNLFVITRPMLTAPTGLIPGTDSIITHGDIMLSWNFVPNADSYMVFVWRNGETMPQTPTFTTNSTHVRMTDYDNSKIYNWRVATANRCDTAISDILHFGIFKQPVLSIDNHNLAFGEQAYNTTVQQSVMLTGRDLTDSIRLSLGGTDISQFCLSRTSVSRFGGSVAVSFTPTVMKPTFDAFVAVASSNIHDTIRLSGSLADYYVFSVSVPDSIMPATTPVPISGTLRNTAGEVQVGKAVDITVTVMGRTTTITDTTDSQGHFGCTYTPVTSECGYYEVSATLHGSASRQPQTTFNIPGVSIVESALPLWEITQYDTVRGCIPVRNRCGVFLNGITLSTSSLPSGLQVQFDTLSLSPFQESDLCYTIVGTVPSTGKRFETVPLTCNYNNSTLVRLNLYYYCHKQIPRLQISFDSLYCSVVPGTQKVVDLALFNNTDSVFNNVQVSVPTDQSEISLLQPDSTYSISSRDSLYVHLLVSVPEDASWGIARGSIIVTADNTQPQAVPYTINPVSDGNGSLMVLVSNEYTHYNNGPYVSGATVTVVGYYNMDTLAVTVTGDDGFATIDSLPEGYYRVYVSAPENNGHSRTVRVSAGETTYIDVDLVFQAVTYEYVVYPTEEEDNYEIVLNTEFKTNVPKPVITIDIPEVNIPRDGSMGSFNIVVTNHGLIDSYDANLEIQASSNTDYFPLFDRIDTLHALSSIVVPCGVRNRDVHEAIESIRNQGGYLIDTLWSVTSYQQLQTTFSDSTILVPTGYYVDNLTGEDLLYYDTMVVSIPHYTTISVLDSTVSHIVYKNATTGEVLLDINMDPMSDETSQAAQAKGQKKFHIHDCENVTVDKAFVVTWYWCNSETRQMDAYQLINTSWKRTLKRCQIESVVSNDTTIIGPYNYDGPLGELDTCGYMYGRLEKCLGRTERDEPEVTEGCKPCHEIVAEKWMSWMDDYLDTKCTLAERASSLLGPLFPRLVKAYCTASTLNKILKDLSECFGINVQFGDYSFSYGNTSGHYMLGGKSLTQSTTTEEYKRLITIASQYHLLQQIEWYRMVGDSLGTYQENPEILAQIVYYLNTTDSATVDGLENCYDQSVATIDTNKLRQYAERWNRTITYSRYGWTSPEQVLPGFSQDFYYPDTNNISEIANLESAAKQEGYESMEDLLVSTLEAMKNHKTKKSTCASVTLQFRQKVAMTREAFEGQLRINNPNDTAAIQGFMANFTVTDTLGHDYTDRFDVRIVSREGVDSTGNIAANSSGTITVRFVPLMSAAPTEPIPYLFGGEISYINPFTSLPKSDELNPVRLTVNPSPHLQFDYFVPHDIIADDPLTSPVIETSIPATIGLRLLNDGKGVANNVRASSISPQITENRQGLVVDFSIVGAMLDGINTSQPLNDIDLGTVNPNVVHTFEYSFLSSLLGTLSIKDIDVIHNSSIDDKDMSLVDARAHRLVKPILQYGQGVDAIHDFLTDDIGNGYNLPDSLYFSDGTQTVVHTADTTTFDHYVEPNDTVVLVTLYPDSIGWNYGETADPGRGKYEIISCIRDDNTVIPLENIWLTFVDLPTDEDPVYVNKLHLADTLSVIRPTSYNVTFSLLPQTLNVDTILNVPSTPLDNPLDSVVVVFNKAIIDSTFSYKDMSLKCNNGVNLMDSTIVIGRINDSTFSVNVSQKNNAIGLYVFNVITDSIVDAMGRYGNGGKSVQWVRTSCTPITVNESRIVCDSLSWNGSWLTNSGVYYDTLAGSLGCDTILALNLTVNNSSTGIETVSACNSFMWHNNEYTASTDTATFISENTVGCDSVTTLNLTINYCSITTITACDSYTWHGEIHTTSGIYVDGNDTLLLTINSSTNGDTSVVVCDTYNWYEHTSLTTSSDNLTHIFLGINQYGCDSTVTLHLTVNYSNTGVDQQTACDTYTWIDGNTYTASNSTIQHTLTNAMGCDSVVTLNLTVRYSTTGTDVQNVCDNYTWIDGNTYITSSDGIATYLTIGSNGCDSVVTLHLTVNYSSTGDTTAVACDSFTWWNTNYTNSTNEPTHTFVNVAGCDSVVTLHLTVNYSNNSVETVTACDSYTWHGNTYTASTSSPTITSTNDAGCDSVTTLNLTVNYSNTGVETVTACNGYVWHNEEYTSSTNTPTFTSTNVAGCDSVTTLHLTIENCSTTEINACDSYAWHGTTYTASGMYFDGTDTLLLTINYSNTGIETVTACDSYEWHGNSYTATTNTPTFTSTNAAGCDSVTTLNLTVNYSNTGVETVTACDSYEWHGNSYTATTNTPTFTSTNAAGCDSVTTLNLTVNYSNTGIETVTACDSYTWWNTNYTNSTNEPTHTFVNVSGCDSVVTLNLTVNYSNTGIETVTACNGYVWHNVEYTSSTNTPTFTSTNVAGCDSVTTLHLTIENCSTTEITACDSYAWHGTTYTASGMYFDGTDTLLLTINYSNTSVETVTACDSYTRWNTNYTNSTNEPTHTFVNVAGCDSVITLNLTVNYSNTGVETVTACNGYVWHNVEYTSSTNTPTFTSTNVAGCDSITTLHLTIENCSTTEITACDSYAWHGTTYTASGMYFDGTDTLLLTINYSNTGVETVTACDSYTWWNTNYTNSTNEPAHTFVNVSGCDSVVTLNLTVNYSNTGIETVTACNRYVWHNVEYTSSTNTPTFTSTNIAGCDSITTLHLTIENCSTTEITACDSYAWHGTTYTTSGMYFDGTDTLVLTINYSNTSIDIQTTCDSYTWIDGNTYTASNNTAQQTLTNAIGCDSVVTLHLTVNYSNTGDTTATACDSFTWWNTNYTNSTNEATHVMTNAYGCDSVVTLHLTVNYSSTGDTTATACDSFTWWNTIYTNSTNEATQTLTNAYGCDSVVTLHLTVNYSSTGDTTAVACDSFNWWNTNFTNSTNEATQTLTNVAGCDSVVTLHLTVNYSVTVHDSLTLASGDVPYDYHGNTVDHAGDYTFDGTTVSGCDSITLLHVEVLEGIDMSDPLFGLKVYPNPTHGTLTVDADDILNVEVFDINGRRVASFENSNTFDISGLAAGSYTLHIKTTRGDTIRRIVKK